MLDIRELKYFAEIAQQKSYTKAAQKLFVSQPALSKTMKSLENRLGFDLFDHDAKGVVLTKSGEALLEQVHPLLAQFDQIMGVLDNLRDWSKGAVVIGSSPLVSTLFMSNIMLEFKSLHPDIYMDVQEKGHMTTCSAVAEGKNDVAIVSNAHFPKQVESELVYRDEMMAVFPKTNPLGERDYVTFGDVQDQSFFFYSNNYYVHHLIIERCREAGYMPRIGSTHAQSEFLLNVLDGENDMAILPRPFLRKQDTSDFCIVPFRPYLEWELSLIYKKNRQLSLAVSEFIACARRKFKEYQKEATLPL